MPVASLEMRAPTPPPDDHPKDEVKSGENEVVAHRHAPAHRPSGERTRLRRLTWPWPLDATGDEH